MSRGTAQSPWPSRSPWISSERLSMVTESTALVLSIRRVKVTGPPGSSMVSGLAVLASVMLEGVSLIVTLASSLSLRALPSSSLPLAVMVSVSMSPASPVTFALKEQL